MIAAMMAVALCACSPSTEPAPPAPLSAPTQAQIAYADAATPADVRLAEIYDRSCRGCHGVAQSGAPLTGHSAAWAAREVEKRRVQMLASVENGMNAMPAKGLCADCSQADFEALIDFMAEEAR